MFQGQTQQADLRASETGLLREQLQEDTRHYSGDHFTSDPNVMNGASE